MALLFSRFGVRLKIRGYNMVSYRINQTELAKRFGVSKAYISMIMSGKKKPSKRIEKELVNFQRVNFRYENNLLSHARGSTQTQQHSSALADGLKVVLAACRIMGSVNPIGEDQSVIFAVVCRCDLRANRGPLSGRTYC